MGFHIDSSNEMRSNLLRRRPAVSFCSAGYHSGSCSQARRIRILFGSRSLLPAAGHPGRPDPVQGPLPVACGDTCVPGARTRGSLPAWRRAGGRRATAGPRVPRGGISAQCLQERPPGPRAERRTLDQELGPVQNRTGPWMRGSSLLPGCQDCPARVARPQRIARGRPGEPVPPLKRIGVNTNRNS